MISDPSLLSRMPQQQMDNSNTSIKKVTTDERKVAMVNWHKDSSKFFQVSVDEAFVLQLCWNGAFYIDGRKSSRLVASPSERALHKRQRT